MHEFFLKHLEGKKVLVWFLISSAVYGTMAVFTLPRLQMLANGLQLFDVKMDGYTPEYALRLLLALGQEGRHIYLTQQMPLDMLYPFTFAVSNSLIIAWLLHKLNWFESPAFYLVLLPIVGGLLDYFENFTVITMLLQFPDVSTPIAELANMFTRTKLLVSIPAFVSLIVLLIILLVKTLIKLEKK